PPRPTIASLVLLDARVVRLLARIEDPESAWFQSLFSWIGYLGDRVAPRREFPHGVSILVLVDRVPRAVATVDADRRLRVSILVLVDRVPRAWRWSPSGGASPGFNPCSRGSGTSGTCTTRVLSTP